RVTSQVESDILIGLPTVRYLPRVGWSTSTTVPVARSDGSSAISFIDRIGPTGMSTALHRSMTSNLVLVMVHASTVLKMCLRRGRRAGGVARRGGVFPCGLSERAAIRPPTGPRVVKVK